MFSRLERLKREARRSYKTYHAELDAMSCGKAMGEYMNPRAAKAKSEFNRVMDELAKIDPTTPAARL